MSNKEHEIIQNIIKKLRFDAGADVSQEVSDILFQISALRVRVAELEENLRIMREEYTDLEKYVCKFCYGYKRAYTEGIVCDNEDCERYMKID